MGTEKFIIDDLGVVLAAGGSGSRFSADFAFSKLLVSSQNIAERYAASHGGVPADFAELPVFMFSVLSFIDFCAPGNFVIVVKASDIPAFEKQLTRFSVEMRPVIVSGGETRSESVLNGLRALPESASFAAIHDAARPLATQSLMLNCLAAARKHGGAVAAKRLTDTLKRTDREGFVLETLDRESVWRVETPQIFKTRELRDAYENALAKGARPTDDAGAMELAGHRPFLVEHQSDNSKITFATDI
ncbi:MAG: 2-C-methyl-D-erythritol 4-phosphate cytidylyltransferase [Victivallales bacterium]|nr:2-C-methyl-D-erythritol 4-phosphate cytidylyltransferase [Victivallales bacterium]